MAAHSSVLAWRSPGTGEPGGLPSMGLHGVGHHFSAEVSCVWKHKINFSSMMNSQSWFWCWKKLNCSSQQPKLSISDTQEWNKLFRVAVTVWRSCGRGLLKANNIKEASAKQGRKRILFPKPFLHFLFWIMQNEHQMGRQKVLFSYPSII